MAIKSLLKPHVYEVLGFFLKFCTKRGYLCEKKGIYVKKLGHFFCLKALNALLFTDINFLKRVKYEYI